MRSLLPAILVMAVLGMHHLAGGPDHTGPAASSGHHAPGPVVAVAGVDPARAGPAVRCCSALSPGSSAGTVSEVPAHPPRDTAPADHGSGHDLLHMCLAILTALAALAPLLYRLGRWWPEGAAGVRGGARRLAGRARPPPATAVRLAALGVLRL